MSFEQVKYHVPSMSRLFVPLSSLTYFFNTLFKTFIIFLIFFFLNINLNIKFLFRDKIFLKKYKTTLHNFEMRANSTRRLSKTKQLMPNNLLICMFFRMRKNVNLQLLQSMKQDMQLYCRVYSTVKRPRE